jgi:predicted house-cleaning noncanonical NTP pyrophosphatase (MazG superfamily)
MPLYLGRPGKLVRDQIPNIIRAAGSEPTLRVLDEGEFHAALIDKLNEECAELEAADPSKLLEEAADVLEVLLALLGLQGLALGDLTDAAAAKRQERGAFTERLWLE